MKSELVLVCEEHVESILVSHLDATIIDTNSDSIIRISEALVSYFHQDTLAVVHQKPNNAPSNIHELEQHGDFTE